MQGLVQSNLNICMDPPVSPTTLGPDPHMETPFLNIQLGFPALQLVPVPLGLSLCPSQQSPAPLGPFWAGGDAVGPSRSSLAEQAQLPQRPLAHPGPHPPRGCPWDHSDLFIGLSEGSPETGHLGYGVTNEAPAATSWLTGVRMGLCCRSGYCGPKNTAFELLLIP